MDAHLKFSVAVPILNEEENIPELYQRLTAVLENLCRQENIATSQYEIVLVDDGSTDASWNRIQALHAVDKRVRGIRFSRNFGHHIAITAGLDYARGDVIILMDGDLQDPPEEIPKLYEKFKQGNDLVYGIRKHRKDPIFKRIMSYFFWWFIQKLTNVSMPRGQTMLRIMSRRIVDVVKEMREFSRFIHGMIAWTGFDIATVEIEHGKRAHGMTKYNLTRQIKLAFHAITSFSTVPLRLATFFGLIISGISFLTGMLFIYQKFVYGFPVLGYASTIASIFFMGGIQLLLLGIFGEYIGRTYKEVQRRPLYVLKDEVNVGAKAIH